MNKRAIGWIGGGLGLAFTFAAGLWSVYPENQEKAAGLYQSAAVAAGLAEAPPAPAPIRNFIVAGFTAPAAPAYAPDTAAQGCSAEGQVVRLAYGTAIIADERQAELLRHPAISGNQEKYMQLRRGAIASALEAQWQAALHADAAWGITGFNLRDPQQGERLQSWLNERAQEIYRTHGLKIAFRVNAASGIQVLPPRSNAIDACTQAGHVPPPLENASPAGNAGPRPF